MFLYKTSKTSNGCLPLQNSSDFDDPVCVLIALTSKFVLADKKMTSCLTFFFVCGGWGGGGAWGWGGWGFGGALALAFAR